MEHPELVHLIRGASVEEVHRGTIVICKNGEILQGLGNTSLSTPMRSTAKPFQLLPLIEAGGVSKFQLSLSDIAVMVSSHNGENQHVKQISSLLERNGISIDSINCGVHPPYLPSLLEDLIKSGKSSFEQIQNNCSGKHAGMLLTCVLHNYETANYWSSTHPLQILILKAISETLDLKSSKIMVSLDGCGVPTFSVPLRNIALGYQKLADSISDEKASPLKVIGNAMINDPYMIAGTDRVETDVMREQRIILKSGSSGTFGIAIPEKAMGIAIKMESGSEDVSEVVALEVLCQLDIISRNSPVYRKHGNRKITTWTNVYCGFYKSVFQIPFKI